MKNKPLHDFLKIGLLAALYFVTARLGLSLGAVNGVATAFWPPTGISLAALLIFGSRMWPGVALGALFANLSIGVAFLPALGIATGNTLEALAGAYLLLHFNHFHRTLERLSDVLSLIFLAAVLSTLISAMMGTTSSWMAGVIPSGHFKTAWGTWWLGDMMGDLIVAPVFLTWSVRSSFPFSYRKVGEGVGLLLLLGFVCQILFGEHLFFTKIPYPLTFLVFPFLIWASLRFRTRFLSLAVLEVSSIAIWNTLQGLGPFVRESLSESLLLLQIFMGVLSATSLILAATVTQRKRAEEALRESEERMRTIIDHAQDAVVLMSVEGRIDSWNPQAETMFGWSAGEAIGKKMSETIIPARYREAHEKGLRRFLITGEGQVLNRRLELTALHQGGSEFPVELTVTPLRLGSDYLFSAFIRDISDRKKAERDRLYLAALVKSSDDAIIGKTLEGIITSWNQGAERLYGYTEKEALGKHISFLVPADRPDEIPKILERLKCGEQIEPYETQRQRKDGTILDFSLAISPIKEAGGTIIGVSAITRDITERKRAEEVLKQKTEELEISNKELEQFATVVSHDLQEPLLKIIAFGDRLKSHSAASLDEKSCDYLLRMQNAATRMRQLIDDLLTFSRVTRAKKTFKKLDLKEIVQRVLSDLEVRVKESGARIEVGSLPTFLGDELQMHRLFQNLISNALKYRKKEEKPHVVLKGGDLHNGFIEIIVSDHGIGFDEKYLDQIFEPFERLHPEQGDPGTGMGLAICKKIVERHGGEITAKSEPEKGSQFIITLPMKSRTH